MYKTFAKFYHDVDSWRILKSKIDFGNAIWNTKKIFWYKCERSILRLTNSFTNCCWEQTKVCSNFLFHRQRIYYLEIFLLAFQTFKTLMWHISKKKENKVKKKVLYMNWISKFKSEELKVCLLVHSTYGYFL